MSVHRNISVAAGDHRRLYHGSCRADLSTVHPAVRGTVARAHRPHPTTAARCGRPRRRRRTATPRAGHAPLSGELVSAAGDHLKRSRWRQPPAAPTVASP
eukprot:ctg_1300.g358